MRTRSSESGKSVKSMISTSKWTSTWSTWLGNAASGRGGRLLGHGRHGIDRDRPDATSIDDTALKRRRVFRPVSQEHHVVCVGAWALWNRSGKARERPLLPDQMGKSHPIERTVWNGIWDVEVRMQIEIDESDTVMTPQETCDSSQLNRAIAASDLLVHSSRDML